MNATTARGARYGPSRSVSGDGPYWPDRADRQASGDAGPAWFWSLAWADRRAFIAFVAAISFSIVVPPDVFGLVPADRGLTSAFGLAGCAAFLAVRYAISCSAHSAFYAYPVGSALGNM